MDHHAYFYEGSVDLLDYIAEAACGKLGLTRAGNPDVQVRAYDKFGIDESRRLGELASLRGVGNRSLFVIGVASITTEAQQALLKLFEEPREGLTFILLAPHGVIIATLRSRMLPFEASNFKNQTSATDYTRKFLEAAPKARSEMLAKILKQDDARERLRNLLNEMESIIYAGEGVEKFETLSEIAAVRPYLADRSPSLKMIFEHLAAVLQKS